MFEGHLWLLLLHRLFGSFRLSFLSGLFFWNFGLSHFLCGFRLLVCLCLFVLYRFVDWVLLRRRILHFLSGLVVSHSFVNFSIKVSSLLNLLSSLLKLRAQAPNTILGSVEESFAWTFYFGRLCSFIQVRENVLKIFVVSEDWLRLLTRK